MSNLLEYLAKISDIRRKQGQRYPLDAVITIHILAMMSGCIGNRAVSRFAKNHEPELREILPLKHGVPSQKKRQMLLSISEMTTLLMSRVISPNS